MVLSQTGKTIAERADGSIVVTEHGVAPDAAGNDDVAATKEAQQAFAASHPGVVQNTVTWVVHDANGTVTIATRSTGDGDETTNGTAPAGPPPPMPPSPVPGSVPSKLNQVIYQGHQNGYTRNTTYDRNVAPDPDGGYTDSDWWLGSDTVTYGGGSTGCGDSGERPCPQPD